MINEPSQQPESSPQSTDEATGKGESLVLTLPDDPASDHDWYLWACVLALLALVAFWPSINGSFLWDDDHYVVNNPALLSFAGLFHIWWLPKLQTIQYYPLTYTAFWLEHHFWADAPLGYRLVNLVLHGGAAIVLWRLLRRLAVPGAWAVAAIWAIHPLQAESVCWISERKNVLSGVLAFSCILFYVDFAGFRDPASPEAKVWKLPRQWQTYALSLVFFILAMFSKTVVCCVPAVLLILLWWKQRLNRETVLGLIPMFVAGAALAALTSHLETGASGMVQATGQEWSLTFVQRLLVAGRAFWFYPAKLLVPVHQSFNYPRIVPDSASTVQWLYVVGAVVVLAGLAAGSRWIGRGPLAAVACYVAALFPSMGFVNVYPFRFSFVADHFQYLAGAALIALAVGVFSAIVHAVHRGLARQTSKPSVPMRWPAVVAAALVVALAAASWVRAEVFISPSDLWEDVLRPGNNPNSWLAASNLGIALWSDATKEFEEADRDYRGGYADASKDAAAQALQLLDHSDSLLWQVINNPATEDRELVVAYNQLADNDITRTRSPLMDPVRVMRDAEAAAAQAIRLEKKVDAEHPNPHPYYTMGMVKINQAQSVQREMYREALPQPTAASTRLSTTRPATPAEQRTAEAFQQALDYFSQAIEVATREADSPAAAPDASDIIQLASFQRGNTDWELAAIANRRDDRTEEDNYDRDAVEYYTQCLQRNRSNVTAHYRLALCLAHFGDLEPAKDHLLIIVQFLDPEHRNAAAYNEIGRIILAQRPSDWDQYNAAVECFKYALQIDPKLSDARTNLDLALKMHPTSRPATRPATQP